MEVLAALMDMSQMKVADSTDMDPVTFHSHSRNLGFVCPAYWSSATIAPQYDAPAAHHG